jgi:hypothetical protein
MALIKTIALPNGSTGNYMRIGTVQMDVVRKYASGNLHLHTSKAWRLSNPTALLLPEMGKIRLRDAMFDRFFSAAVINGTVSTGDLPTNHFAQLYAAFHYAFTILNPDKTVHPLCHVISDYDLSGAADDI